MSADVTVDLTAWIGQTQIELDACLADLAQVCSAAEKQSYADNLASHRFGITRLVLEHAHSLGANASERAERTCFLTAIGKFISFLDKLIASQRIAKQGIVVTRNIAGQADLDAYLNEYMKEQIAKVAWDTSLSNPKKIDAITGIELTARAIALEYFQLRRVLEHHQDTPATDLNIPIRRVALFVDNIEITRLPHPISGGQLVEMRIITDNRKFPAGVKLVISPQDAHDLVFTMRHVLAPEIFRAHVAASC